MKRGNRKRVAKTVKGEIQTTEQKKAPSEGRAKAKIGKRREERASRKQKREQTTAYARRNVLRRGRIKKNPVEEENNRRQSWDRESER